MWPWQRHRAELEQVQAEIDRAAREKEAAERRRDEAAKQAAWSRATSAVLRREIAKNHFTELLQQAMGRRT